MTVIGRFFINGPGGGFGIVCAICGTTMLNVDDALYHPIHAVCPNTIKYFERPTIRLGEIPPSSPITDPAAIDPSASYDAVKGENAGKSREFRIAAIATLIGFIAGFLMSYLR